MRPLVLRLKGFTAFRDEQEIDFRDLDLFAVWGPTGSGKSSILDAITYALYGKVARVEGVREETLTGLISHGQPRLAVTLDFDCGGSAYRITRTLPRGGQTKVRLERSEGEDWVSFGEGADRVRDVNRAIVELVGLDFDAFTRAVILPQGKFAEFLTGDADERRSILTELLGLELFGRMAKAANEISRDARVAADTKTGIVEGEYAGVDKSAVAAARKTAEQQKGRAKAARDLEVTLTDLNKLWEAERAAAEALAKLSEETADVATDMAGTSRTLLEQARRATEAEKVLKTASSRCDDLEKKRERARAERAHLEKTGGSLEHLTELRLRAEKLGDLRAESEGALLTLEERQRQLDRAQRDEKAAGKAVADAKKRHESAERKETEARVAHEEAHRVDLVAAVVQGLGPGDPCPVCERPLEHLPAVDAAKLETAGRTIERAEAARKEAEEKWRAAQLTQAKATENVKALVETITASERDSEGKKARVAEEERVLASALGGPLPDDVTGVFGDRVGTLKDLLAGERTAEEELNKANDELRRCEREVSAVHLDVTAARTRLAAAPLTSLLQRLDDAGIPQPDLGVPIDLPDGAHELATIASRAADALKALAEGVSDRAVERRDQYDILIEKARRAVPEGLEIETEALEDMLAASRELVRTADTEAARASDHAEALRQKLAARTKLEAEISEQRREQKLYSDLGKELKNDRIVQYLQGEALVVLAAAATEHLRELSDDRYRLSYEEERFFVVDAWNGDERRSVRTLSGGETFLASLALALGLSEQVQLLAVTETARLDSLFLDEGFGTLDAETLDVSIRAIGRLGGDGRLVGVITHVGELAEAMPVRIEVSKSQRGSRVGVSTTEIPSQI
jgi:exonuclease SbcC